MKRSFWIFAVAILTVGICGCGGGETEKEKPTSSAAPASASPETTAMAPTDVDADNPQKAVNSFLQAMSSGDEKVAEAMLTTKAREETKRHDLAVQPPGTPNAKYQVGRVEYPETGAAYVHCLWTETYEDQSEETYEVVWVLLKETAGWRIAGIAMQLVEGAEPAFLNFENPVEMMETVRMAEAAGQQQAESTTAATDGGQATSIR